MELILTRIAKRKTYTIGRLAIRKEVNDEYLAGTADEYFCDTLEPTWRDYAHGGRKIKGRSAIPEGRYAVVISWSPKMKAWLPILLGVPNFEGIRIAFDDPEVKGWMLLRMSLHDPVMPMNLESAAEGGVAIIEERLAKFFGQYDKLAR